MSTDHVFFPMFVSRTAWITVPPPTAARASFSARALEISEDASNCATPATRTTAKTLTTRVFIFNLLRETVSIGPQGDSGEVVLYPCMWRTYRQRLATKALAGASGEG